MSEEIAIFVALQTFAESVTQKFSQITTGEPEDQLRGPFERFMQDVGKVLALSVICTGETKLPGRLGKPDYAIHSNKLLAGYVELKAPGAGANPNRYTGHNRDQWRRFAAIPNLIYCDGTDWGLYRSGEAVGQIVRLSGDVGTDGKAAVMVKDAEGLLQLLTDFLEWQPIVPNDAKGLAKLLAPLCRMLRGNVNDALKDAQSPLVQLGYDWRQLLFPDATDDQFADAYAQTVCFALLLARSEGADPLTLDTAEKALAAEHNLLSRALQVLTDPNAQAEISPSLNLLLRVLGEVSPQTLTDAKDPWLYFYEDFLAAYDPKLRKDAGAYYTPVEVVHAQVRLIDDLLTNRLGKSLGFADRGVVTLDPAVGTGTYLLGVIDHALRRVEIAQGSGAVAGQGSALAGNIFGFEIMVGPYAVSELRISRAFLDLGAKLPKGGLGIYLTDTLESPHTTPPQLPLFLQPIAHQHERALEVKDNVRVIVCLGNPPYDRHQAADKNNKARTGGWVRWGNDSKGTTAIFRDFLDPAVAAKYGIHVKNLYNLYVYFWRWALWKVFEHKAADGQGIVSYISASSYLEGDAFVGMRKHMRCVCDEIWILDLGGEGRGPRKSDNVFAIQTPVAIALAVRYGKLKADRPGKVHFARIEGTRDEKLDQLEALHSLGELQWQDCPSDWCAPFRPAGVGKYFDWPLLGDLFPWQHSGAQFKRTWPIAPDPETLKRRWRTLSEAVDKAEVFKETRDRKVNLTYAPLPPDQQRGKPINQLSKDASPPRIERYGYRSFDRQWAIADNRVGDFLRPQLWEAHSKKQVYITTAFTQPLSSGPPLTACAEIPDLHFFSGRGAKDVIPLYRDSQANQPNIAPGLLEVIEKTLNLTTTAEDLFSYAYGIMAQPAFTERFTEELGTQEIRIPITKNSALFIQVRDIGKKLLWLHTYGQRFVPKDKLLGEVPRGSARCIKGVSHDPNDYPDRFEYGNAAQILTVGSGKFGPVSPEIWGFEVSGFKVVKSWLDYRMRAGHGRRSSCLDSIRPECWNSDLTTELLELLWVLELTIEQYNHQAELLEAVIKGTLFDRNEFLPVPDHARQAPTKQFSERLFAN